MEEVLSNYFNKRLVFSVAQQISIEDYYSCVKRAFSTLSIHSNTQTHITQTLQTHSQEYWACVMRAATEDSSNLTKAVILCDRTWPLWALKSVKRSISSNSVTHTHTYTHCPPHSQTPFSDWSRGPVSGGSVSLSQLLQRLTILRASHPDKGSASIFFFFSSSEDQSLLFLYTAHVCIQSFWL